MSSLWRQTVSLHPSFAPLNRCLEQDWFLLPFEIRLQRAHARTLRAAGILTDTELASLEAALDRLAAETAGAACPESDAEDLHTWVEGRLTEWAGDAGRKIHTARSRNDQVATLLKLYTIDAATRSSAALAQLQRTAAEKAIAWADVEMPLMTHTQAAAPGSAGFWALRYAAAFDRVRRAMVGRVGEWRRECPLGAGAVAGSSIAIDRGLQARELGFDGPSLCALDSTTTRDECLELLALATQAALHLQSFATDVILFSQTWLGWVQYPPAFGTGSSMMPNKRNPDAMELLRGEACRIAGAHASLVLMLKGLPSGYNRDLQCVKPLVHDAAETLVSLVDMAAAFFDQLAFDAAHLAAAMQAGHIGATLRMESFVQGGVPLRQAHHQVADEVTHAASGADPQIERPLEQYRTLGSAHPEQVRAAAATLRAAAAS